MGGMSKVMSLLKKIHAKMDAISAWLNCFVFCSLHTIQVANRVKDGVHLKIHTNYMNVMLILLENEGFNGRRDNTVGTKDLPYL